MGALGSIFAGWSLVGLCLWFRYPVSGVGVDCANINDDARSKSLQMDEEFWEA